MKDKIKKIMEKDGFYITLFVCVCVVATTAVWASKNNIEKAKEEKIIEEELIVDTREIEEQLEMEPTLASGEFEEEKKENEKQTEPEKPVEEKEPEPEVKEPEAPQNEEKTPSTEIEGMITPVENGTLGLEFTEENLIYSTTLEEWTSHEGVDFYAKEGTTIVASGSGVVREIYEDDLWGTVIILDHGNEILTKYASLQTNKMVNEGQKVAKGDPISKVGKTAAIEQKDKPHLHFEVIKDGVPVNPKQYITNLK